MMSCICMITATQAQYLHFMPDMVNYINSDVTADKDGTTFRYLYQDSTLKLHRILLRTDNGGKMQWAARTENYSSHAFTSDSSMIMIGGVRTSNGSNIALLQKNDKTGAKQWIIREKGSSDLGYGNVLVNDSDIIYVTATSSSFFNSTYYSKNSVSAFDANGTFLWVKYFANPTFTTDYKFSRVMLASNGDFIGVADIRGSTYKSANGMMITRINQQGDIIFSRYFDFYDTHNQLSVTGLAEAPNGDIIFGGRLMTDQISQWTNTMWMARIDAAGVTQIQKTYHADGVVGEQLHSVRYAAGKLYAYIHLTAPNDTPNRAFIVAELDPQTLSITKHTVIAENVTLEDPYGDVANAFTVTSDGKPTFSGGVYCTAREKYVSVMGQFDATLSTGCTKLEGTKPLLVDSIANYKDTVYKSSGTFSITNSSDTSNIYIYPALLPTVGDLCKGCATVTPPEPPQSIAAHSTKDGLTVYPNPANGVVRVDYKPSTPNAKLQVYNNMGAVVYTTTIAGNATTIDISSQPKGIYYIRVQDGTTTYAEKLIRN